ncbi:MAG: dihydroneopterin aldolase [Gammaproteobacteria bacterium]
MLKQTGILRKIKLKMVTKDIGTMDIIYLRDLRIDTVIGIYDWERRMKQTIILDLEMGTDIRKAANSDNIDDTLNYKAVAKRLMTFVGDSEFELVETLAERITEIIMAEFAVPWCRLSLNKKGAVRGVRDVGVIIERGNKE